MNFIDHIVAVISPEAAYKRESYRQAYEALRQYYDAGDYSRTNANWRVMNASAENTDRYSRDNVRARARDPHVIIPVEHVRHYLSNKHLYHFEHMY